MRDSLSALAVVLAMSSAAWAQGADQAARLQKKIEECSRHVSERFVFFGGGSGVLITDDGFCLTNHHVAGQLPTTRVTLHNGKTYPAKLVCTDALGDLSLFKIDVGRLLRSCGFEQVEILPFDERGAGTIESGTWPPRPEWHFPWSVIRATRSGPATRSDGASATEG